MADENKSAQQESYRRELGQARRLPRLRPETSGEPDTTSDTDESDEGSDQEMPADDFSNGTDTAEADTTEEQAEEEAEEEEAEEEAEEQAAEEEAVAGQGGGGADSSKAQKEAIDRLKKEATKKAQEGVMRLASKLKIAKIGAALTLVGIIVTYLIMTMQFIVGNCLEKPWMPKLSLGEIILWVILTSLLVLVMAIAFVVLMILLAIALGPVVALTLFGKELLNFIF